MGRVRTITAVALVALVGCGGERESRTTIVSTNSAAAWSPWSDRAARLSTDVPRGWHVTRRPLTSLALPEQRLVVSSFPIRPQPPDRNCSPKAAVAQMPRDGAMLILIETRSPTRDQLARIPSRPARFRLDRSRLKPYECLGPSYGFTFRDHRRLLLAHVYVGRRASAATRAKVAAVLDRLRVGAPDPRYAAVWRRPFALLSRTPYLGVACPTPNSVACDRVGLQVELRHAAASVSATIDGRELRLDDAAWSGAPSPNGRRRSFAGFLQPAGLLDGPLKVTPDDGPARWVGRTPVRAGVGLTIRRSEKHYVRTSLIVRLAPGWG